MVLLMILLFIVMYLLETKLIYIDIDINSMPHYIVILQALHYLALQ
jgi:hypothetical protein